MLLVSYSKTSTMLRSYDTFTLSHSTMILNLNLKTPIKKMLMIGQDDTTTPPTSHLVVANAKPVSRLSLLLSILALSY